MFHFSTSHSLSGALYARVTPFGNLRINIRLQLPAAYRSLTRPSSSSGTKASTTSPYFSSRVCPASVSSYQETSLSKDRFCSLVGSCFVLLGCPGLTEWTFTDEQGLSRTPEEEENSSSLLSIVFLGIQAYPSAGSGGPDWTRTSDPRLIKAML